MNNKQFLEKTYPDNKKSPLNKTLQKELTSAIKILNECEIPVTFENLIQHFANSIIFINGTNNYTLIYPLNIYEFCKENKIYVSEKMYQELSFTSKI